ncbi:MAG: precorrin-4 C(11)-methyltransferase [Desulfobulbaceae bacterium]|nr:precorrin-4 C(11)-methyltransferase [Desulfobulbaceae bacterium]
MTATNAVLSPIFFVGAGPGDPDLLTLKGRRLLDNADLVVYAGSLVNPALLNGIRAECHDSAGLDLAAIMALMIPACRAGKKVVRLHTGDPAMYGAIREQMQWLDRENLPYEVVPGVSSAFAAAASLRRELTVPEQTQTVILTRQAGRTPVPEREALSKLAAIGASMCIFLSVGMMEEVVADLLAGGYVPDTAVAVVEKASWPDERIVQGTLADIAARVQAAGIRKTAMIVVGPALDDASEAVSRLYAEDFSHGCR